MMNVELMSHTPDALTLLLRTKGTRLAHDDDPATWTEHKRLAELGYMKDTIKSSWEFVNYTFRISGVSRAFTHQLVRTRTGHYAQESQRTVDVRDHQVVEPRFPDGITERIWFRTTLEARQSYADLLDEGMPVQDARGVLPTAIATSIIAQFSLRTLHEMAITRLCVRTQGEYQDVFRAMKRAVVAVHPWAEAFIRVGCAQNGICVFPRYTECPIQPYTFTVRPEYKAVIEHIAKMADNERHEATPVAKEGRTM